MRQGLFAAAIIAGLGSVPGLPGQARAAETLTVVATIKPVHSLASAIMEGVGEAQLLIDGAGSPHSYALRPSQARSLNRVDIIIRVSENLESFLEKPIESLSKDARLITLAEIPGLKLLPVREGGAFEAHDHGHEHGGEKEAHGQYDPHLWLSPTNAAVIADYLASVLSETEPDKAATFRANAANLKARLAALDRDLRASLEPVKGKPFIVFHDAYQYFENHYGLAAAGAITLSPERQIGAARIREIREEIVKTNAACVFSEPQFKPRLLQTVTEGTHTMTGVLDPLGADLPPGKDQYFQLMTKLAKNLKECLASPS
jgi:zinc transport system substrate-binding protein